MNMLLVGVAARVISAIFVLVITVIAPGVTAAVREVVYINVLVVADVVVAPILIIIRRISVVIVRISVITWPAVVAGTRHIESRTG